MLWTRSRRIDRADFVRVRFPRDDGAVSERAVEEEVPMDLPSRKISYPVTPTSSVEAGAQTR